MVGDYVSKHQGQVIDEGVDKALTAVQGIKVNNITQPKDNDNVINLDIDEVTVGDVKVDGTSVVDNNKVANIDLTGKLNKNQGATNSGKQLVISSTGDIVVDTIKRTITFESLTIEGTSDTFCVETITNGSSTMKIATSMTNPSIVYRSSDGGSSYHMPYAIWHS